MSAGTTTGVAACEASPSTIFQPETLTGVAPRFFSSTQSATWSPFDSTSLIFTSGGPVGPQALGAPRVEVVTPKAPVPSGQRPQVAACVSAGYVVESSRFARSGVYSRTESPLPRPKDGLTSTTR